MMRRKLQALILQTRGGHALPLVTSRIEEMSEEEARQWLVLLQNLHQDAESDGVRTGARQPWKGF